MIYSILLLLNTTAMVLDILSIGVLVVVGAIFDLRLV